MKKVTWASTEKEQKGKKVTQALTQYLPMVKLIYNFYKKIFCITSSKSLLQLVDMMHLLQYIHGWHFLVMIPPRFKDQSFSIFVEVH